MHGGDPDYREALLALMELLSLTQDPETEDKVMQVLNSDGTPRAVAQMLESYLKNTKAQRHKDTTGPWAAQERAYAANKKYLNAARLLDSGKTTEAQGALEELLSVDPQYPLALMLKQLISSLE
jgi:hypothetical protein